MQTLRPPIYFSGSISGGRDDVALYGRIAERLRAAGYEVVSGEVTDPTVASSGCELDDEDIWERDLERLEQVARRGGILVAEASRPSLGVGYEIATARWKHRMQVAVLWREKWSKRCSAMIAGDPDVIIVRYDEEDLDSAVESLIVAIEELCDDAGAIVS